MKQLRIGLAGAYRLVWNVRFYAVDARNKDRQIALQILRYAAEHPEAKDSVVGIRLWWLREPEQWTEEEVKLVANNLIDQGMFCRWEPLPGSFVLGPTKKFLECSSHWMSELELGP